MTGDWGANWVPVFEAASHVSSAEAWSRNLAEKFEEVVRPDVVAVYLSGLGNVLDAGFAAAPESEGSVAQALVDRVLPELYATGAETPAVLFAEASTAGGSAPWMSLRAELLRTHGFCELTGSFMRLRDGCVLGWIALFSRSADVDALRRLRAPLAAVCRAAETTIRNAISLAELVGVRVPKVVPSVLSLREKQIAALAARGFSDLNIGHQLRISEGTVGRHLHSIYSKLGVNSRGELQEVLAVLPSLA